MHKVVNLPAPRVTHPLVNDLFDGVQQILGDNLLDFYLGGSLAIGDFDEDRSDLDFLVIAKGEFTDDSIQGLHELHDNVRASNKNRLYTNYEGVYLTTDQAAHPKTSGFVVYGAPPIEVIGDITTDDMLQAKIQLFKGWWLPKLHAKEPMDDEYQAYAVLTMARILYGIEKRDEASKKKAAAWCAEQYPQYADLLREALAWEIGDTLNKQGETYGLIGFVAERV
jgi:hypothetical protein